MSIIPTTLKTLSLSAIILFAASCSKDDAEPTLEQKITKTWLMTDLTATIGTQTESVYLDNVELCMRDNEYAFGSTGTITVNGGANKCDIAETTPLSTGDYLIQDGGKKISLSAEGIGEGVFDIDEVTGTSMKFSQTDVSTGFPIKITLVFTAK